MRKIAILTQPLGRNYGGILQNFALQKTLKNHDWHPVTINRWSNRSLPKWRVLWYYTKIEKFFYRENFKFLKKHLNLTERIDSEAAFRKHFLKNQYDAFLVGSDQTWRPKYSPNIFSYFLDFLFENAEFRTSKKIAYASSFGTSEWEFTEAQTQKIKPLVQQFDAVSVREDSGVDLCREHLEIQAEHVLDPTLLLDKEVYQDLYSDKNYPEKKGIFVYVLDKKTENDHLIETIKNKLGKETFRNQPKSAFSKKSSIKDEVYPPLESWLKSFDDADFIITDSFHGTVFSILYAKPFVTIINQSRGASRFYSLLKPLGLIDRIVTSNQELTETFLQKPIPYDLVREKMLKWRAFSLDFLFNSLADKK